MSDVGSGPMTREQVDALVAEMLAGAVEAGECVAQETMGDGERERLAAMPEAFHDLRARVGLILERTCWAMTVLMLDDQDRLAECDRADLVAEALFIRSGV